MIRPLPKLDQIWVEKLRARIDGKTKPLGSLGLLEHLAIQIGYIQQSETPAINNPHVLVFAGDHGIAADPVKGVSAYPQVVTAQMVKNFLAGGAAINVFCRQQDIGLSVVDAGVAEDLSQLKGLIDRKIARGTRDFSEAPAMNADQLMRAINAGGEEVDRLRRAGCNTLACGEMGIGNTSSASMLMHGLTGIPLVDCIGAGAGLDEAGVQRKVAVLKTALAARGTDSKDPLGMLQNYGGFEIAMMVGAFLRAGHHQMVIVVDGFIASVAALVAVHLSPLLLEFMVFAHASSEHGHGYLLRSLGVTPLLQLDMRLGEGTGAALAMPLLRSAAGFVNEMASFDDAGVSTASEQKNELSAKVAATEPGAEHDATDRH